MELIEGITLKSYIDKKGKLSVKETISITIQIANGIECAHNNQIVHRDIKPQNIMISREGKVKVTDFGIARAASANTINVQWGPFIIFHLNRQVDSMLTRKVTYIHLALQCLKCLQAEFLLTVNQQ